MSEPGLTLAILAQFGDLIVRYRALTAQLDWLLDELERIEQHIAEQRAALEILCSDN